MTFVAKTITYSTKVQKFNQFSTFDIYCIFDESQSLGLLLNEKRTSKLGIQDKQDLFWNSVMKISFVSFLRDHKYAESNTYRWRGHFAHIWIKVLPYETQIWIGVTKCLSFGYPLYNQFQNNLLISYPTFPCDVHHLTFTCNLHVNSRFLANLHCINN